MIDKLETTAPQTEQNLAITPEFLEEISSLNSDPKAKRELMNLIKDEVYDFGTRQHRILEIIPGEIQESTGSSILTRTALINIIERRFKTPEETFENFTLFEFDLKDFRNAGMAKDAEGRSSADLIANKVAEGLNELVYEVVNSGILVEKNLAPARIGGDEFGMLVCGKLNKDQAKVISRKITEKITNIRGWFIDNKGEASFRNLELKGGVEEISVPNDLKMGEKFWKHMKRGILLCNKELEKEMHQREIEQEIAASEGKVAPDSEMEIESFLKRCPEFLQYFDLLNKAAGGENPELKSKLYETIKYSVFDRLIGERVQDMKKFSNEFINNPPTKINIIEIQGIKEQNDINSLSAGDETILKLWEKILEILENELTKQEIKIYRRGGTFMIAEWGEKLIDEKKIDKLNRISSITVDGIEMPIGFNTVPSRGFHRGKDSKETSLFLDRIFKKTTIDSYAKILRNNLDNPEIFRQKKDKELPKQLTTNEEFIQVYFWGKRQVERISLMKEAILILEKTGGQEVSGKIKPIKEIFGV